MSSTSSSPSRANKPGCIQDPRPQPLIVSAPPAAAAAAVEAETNRPSKKPRASGGGNTGPVIVYELTPRVVHAHPEEFMAVVQKLTGKQSVPPVPTLPAASTGALPAETDTAVAMAADPLVPALGQHRQPAPPAIDDHPAPPPSSPADAFLLSPSSLFFSPTTMRAFQELAALL